MARAAGAANTGTVGVGPMLGTVVSYMAVACSGHTDRTSASAVAAARVARPMRGQCCMARMNQVPGMAGVPSEQGGAAHARGAAAAAAEECAALDVADGEQAEPDVADNGRKLAAAADGAPPNDGDEVRMHDGPEVVGAGM